MNLLYFLPDDLRGTISWDMLPDCVRPQLAGAPIECHKCNRGPTGGAGLLLSAVPSDPAGVQATTRFHPEKQLWSPAGDFWIGCVKDARPTPADLRRRTKPIDGRLVKFRDGAEWLVPVVGPSFSRLPKAFANRNGEGVLEIAREYQDLAAESSEHFAWMLDPESQPRPWLPVMGFVARCLGLNYHLGPIEVGELGLLDTDVADECLETITGYRDLVEQVEAKKGE